MQIDTQMIDQYLDDLPLSYNKDFLMTEVLKPDKNRKEVVFELRNRLQDALAQFPSFNRSLFYQLFPNMDTSLDSYHIIFIVGSNQFYKTYVTDRSTSIVIDLIQCANMTHIVSQMMYLILHTLHYEIAHSLILAQYPLPKACRYTDWLNHLSFVEGFASYLSWNEDAEQYKFHAQRYELQKEKAFAMLLDAFYINSEEIQREIIASMPDLPFWSQFPVTASIFYIDDLFRSSGERKISSLYKQGWDTWIQTIYAIK